MVNGITDGSVKMKARTKKRNPQDSTRRNTQAANKRIRILEEKVAGLDNWANYVESRLQELAKKTPPVSRSLGHGE